MKTLLSIRSELDSVYDGSTKGVSVKVAGNVTTTKTANRLLMKQGYLEPGPMPELDKADSFTLEATINPSAIDKRQNIMDSQSPPVDFYIDEIGFLVGSINLRGIGWKSIKSNVKLSPGKDQHVIFSRDSKGKMVLEIDTKKVGETTISGIIEAVGKEGFRIGTKVDGKTYQYKGEIGNIQIRIGAFTAKDMNARIASAKKLEKVIIRKVGPNAHVFVNPSLDESHTLLLAVKDVMNSAGVDKLSDLSTLRLTVPTTITRGKVLIAPKKNSLGTIDWSKLATEFKKLNAGSKKTFIAKYLTNRNSTKEIKTAKTVPTPGDIANLTGPVTRFAGRIDRLDDNIRTGLRIPRDAISINPTLEALRITNTLTDHISIDKKDLTVINRKGLLENIESKLPEKWLQLQPLPRTLRLLNLPVNSSVIIAGTLDLTNTQMTIEPDVEKLYIIAESVICGSNAKITWRRPGGSTPPRLDNPDLNGTGYSGVHTRSGSRDGLDGTNGRPAENGINAQFGRNSPSIEIWVKNLTNIPNIDLNGEDGIKGGTGQRGGKGGNGADGKNGTYRWVWTPFGNIEWCDDHPGNGGDGGDGGRGGNGGKGGDGGAGGKITIGVLEGTLAATITAGQFHWKNQGGQKGSGGNPGPGGLGGAGGARGYTTHCDQANNGHNGAQGQPGAQGAGGSNLGMDGIDQFFEFSEDAWDEMLTRPWITEIAPNELFPGNSMIIRGSRFANNDRVVIDGIAILVPVINPDESLTVTIPATIPGGQKSVFVRRAFDGTESNHIPIFIKPQLDVLPSPLMPATSIILTGKAILPNASVLINGSAIPGNVNPSGTEITFTMIGTGGSGSSGGTVSVAIRNPDGFISNVRTSMIPRILEIPFTFGVHDLPFSNFSDGLPTWGTYEDTFGATEVWHEQLDPVFGHPILTAAYYGFYHYFLKGTANGGLATGFCTSLSCLVADKLWQGLTNAHTTTKASVHSWLTAVHGKLLSRESLIHFHDQGQQGVSRVELTVRAIERTFLTGCDRNVAPLLFFIPSGSIWDAGYFDKLGSTHCIMPYRFVYPAGHTGPELSAGGLTTVSSLDGVKLFCWDCNHPGNANCRLEFRLQAGVLHFSYYPDGTCQFDSTLGITLGHWTNGDYLLADHDLPFSGPFGLTSFIIDFLLSPADLEITNEYGLRVGNFNNMIYSEIADSHPAYLIKGAYLLPVGQNLTRRIVGNGTGNYTFNSLMPDGTTITLENVPIKAGQRDTLIINTDGSQIRVTPHEEKNFSIVISKLIGDQVRALGINNIGGGPGTDIDITVAPDLSLLRLGNRSNDKNVTVKALSLDKQNNAPVNKSSAVTLKNNSDLVVTVSDWALLDLGVDIVTF